jgi:hypothetical protein
VQKLLAQFVPVADEVGRLRWATGPEGALFRKIPTQPAYYLAGKTRDPRPVQGTYALAPSGVLLGSCNINTDPMAMSAVLEKALAKWKQLPRKRRLPAGKLPPRPRDQRRFEELYPRDGLVLRVTSRDLPRRKTRQAQPQDWRGSAWNQGFAWFRKGEARQFLPADPKPGAVQQVPAKLVRLLARYYLVDNARGETDPFPDKAVEKAELKTTVVRRAGGVVSLKIQGATRTAATGVAKRPRGFDARLHGRATYNLQTQRFESFALVAAGMRWGGTRYNGRGEDGGGSDLGPAPLGISFTLAGESPAERIAPAFMWQEEFRKEYGWHY